MQLAKSASWSLLVNRFSCYESPKKEVISHAFEHLIHNIKMHNGVKI